MAGACPIAKLAPPQAMIFLYPPGQYGRQVNREHEEHPMTTTDWTTESAGSGQYADVNGVSLYYETHGAGHTMILLHGGLFSGEMFGPILPTLADHHQV